ncbi:MAG: hypothetical protein M3042_03040 [Actinomycetota bacterium]|nr:hypothetical protein [Actinomycetota bacterium]
MAADAVKGNVVVRGSASLYRSWRTRVRAEKRRIAAMPVGRWLLDAASMSLASGLVFAAIVAGLNRGPFGHTFFLASLWMFALAVIERVFAVAAQKQEAWHSAHGE